MRRPLHPYTRYTYNYLHKLKSTRPASIQQKHYLDRGDIRREGRSREFRGGVVDAYKSTCISYMYEVAKDKE